MILNFCDTFPFFFFEEEEEIIWNYSSEIWNYSSEIPIKN